MPQAKKVELKSGEIVSFTASFEIESFPLWERPHQERIPSKKFCWLSAKGDLLSRSDKSQKDDDRFTIIPLTPNVTKEAFQKSINDFKSILLNRRNSDEKKKGAIAGHLRNLYTLDSLRKLKVAYFKDVPESKSASNKIVLSMADEIGQGRVKLKVVVEKELAGDGEAEEEVLEEEEVGELSRHRPFKRHKSEHPEKTKG
eukprot:g7575.t1